jgi:hypothetical protein
MDRETKEDEDRETWWENDRVPAYRPTGPVKKVTKQKDEGIQGWINNNPGIPPGFTSAAGTPLGR